MKVYIASSWNNKYQPKVVKVLRKEGHKVFDFRGGEGLRWADSQWGDWTKDWSSYLNGLNHTVAQRSFNRDMRALKEASACVYVMPCGVSASLEAGWACGNSKLLIVYIPELVRPDLMVKMANLVTTDLNEVVNRLR